MQGLDWHLKALVNSSRDVVISKTTEGKIIYSQIQVENEINRLLGRFPEKIHRSSIPLCDHPLFNLRTGVPSDLLENRPDVVQAELQLLEAKLDVKVARANFYPALRITSGVGLEAFNAAHLLKSPQSLLYNLAGDLLMPLLNKSAIKAEYQSANSRQIQAVLNYEQVLLKAHFEVLNQVSKIENLEANYNFRLQQVDALLRSTEILGTLFSSARADYMEVLMTQRDALEARMELVGTREKQFQAYVSAYRALGGGWSN
ncbi:MAG: multidrug efflux system outer membrane protein [Luteibaculaceae bacterium]|jgi:multidrug efflux system outer membrane protein